MRFTNPTKFYVDFCMYIFLGRVFKRILRLSNSLKVKNLCREREKKKTHGTPTGKLAFAAKWNSGGARNFKSDMHLNDA